MRGVSSRNVDLAQADLSAVYPALTDLTRTLIRLPGGTALVIDDVAAVDPHIFSIVWHPGQEIVPTDQGNNTLLLANGSSAVAVRTFATNAITSAMSRSPFPLALYEHTEQGHVNVPSQWEVSAKKPATEALFVTLVQPQTSLDATWKVSGASATLTTRGWQLHIRRTPVHPLAITASFSDGRTVDLTH